MADQSDVENALAELAASLLYPAGPQGVGGWDVAGGWGVGMAYGSLTALRVSAAGLPIRIYRGWPVAQQLDPDLGNGIAHVTIFERSGMGRLAGGNLDDDVSLPGPAPTIAAVVAGNTVTLAGIVTAGNIVGLLVDGQPVTHVAQPGDTLATIAATLARMLGGGTPLDGLLTEAGAPLTVADPVTIGATPDGAATLTITTTRPIQARVGAMGISLRRPRQQSQTFMVTCWAPDPAARDAVCSFIDARLSDIRWLTLLDQKARLLWAGTRTDDVSSKARTWRRDIFYTVTWWTTLTRAAPPVLFGRSKIAGGLGPSIAATS